MLYTGSIIYNVDIINSHTVEPVWSNILQHVYDTFWDTLVAILYTILYYANCHNMSTFVLWLVFVEDVEMCNCMYNTV